MAISYQPVFKAKPGEFKAWSNASATVRAAATPVFELAWDPNTVYFDYLNRTVKSLADTASGVVVVDAGNLDQTLANAPGGLRIIPWLQRKLSGFGVKFRPVVRFDDDPVVVADAAAASTASGAGVTVRMGGDGAPPVIADVAAGLPTLLTQLGAGYGDAHLILDYRVVHSSALVTVLTPAADAVLAWLGTQPAFGSIHVTSGAFPASISHLAKQIANYLPRFDAQFFTGLTIPAGLDIGYGDYAVNYPGAGSGGRGPLPNIRYVVDDQWLVWREPHVNPGFYAFYIVADKVTALPQYAGRGYSWGDLKLDNAAHRVGGPGGASEWRSFSTSHHLQTVVDRLSILGAP